MSTASEPEKKALAAKPINNPRISRGETIKADGGSIRVIPG